MVVDSTGGTECAAMICGVDVLEGTRMEIFWSTRSGVSGVDSQPNPLNS